MGADRQAWKAKRSGLDTASARAIMGWGALAVRSAAKSWLDGDESRVGVVHPHHDPLIADHELGSGVEHLGAYVLLAAPPVAGGPEDDLKGEEKARH